MKGLPTSTGTQAPVTSRTTTPTGNLTAGRGTQLVALQWDGTNGAATYNVKRSTTQAGPYSVIATGITTTSYTDSGLTNGTRYYYVVSGSNASGEGPNSNEASAVPALAVRINSGGAQYISAATSTLWQADTAYTGGSAYTFSPRPISNTSDPALYLPCRYGTDFTYSIPVPAGSYN